MSPATQTLNRPGSVSALHGISTLFVISLLAYLVLCITTAITTSLSRCTTVSTHLQEQVTQWQHQRFSVNQSPWWQTLARLSKPLTDSIDWLHRKTCTAYQHQTTTHAIMQHLVPQHSIPTVHCVIRLVKLQAQRLWHKWVLTITMLPWCVIAIGIGVSEGLVKRYIRTCELGRESTFAFHCISGQLWRFSLLVWWGYWLIGDAMIAKWVLMGFAIVIGLTCYQRCAHFKKYV